MLKQWPQRASIRVPQSLRKKQHSSMNSEWMNLADESYCSLVHNLAMRVMKSQEITNLMPTQTTSCSAKLLMTDASSSRRCLSNKQKPITVYAFATKTGG
jgi:hypothetical protein